MKLKNKIALVTGSGQGLGSAIAKRIAQEGAKLIINDLDKEKAEKFSKELRGFRF